MSSASVSGTKECENLKSEDYPGKNMLAVSFGLEGNNSQLQHLEFLLANPDAAKEQEQDFSSQVRISQNQTAMSSNNFGKTKISECDYKLC